MTDPAADAARSAAVILAPDLGPNLPAEVEAALAARDTQQRPDRYLDPVSLRQPDRGHRHPRLDHLQRPAQPHPRPTTQTPSPARSASPCATRTRPCPPAPSASPKSSPPRSPATPARPGNQAQHPRTLTEYRGPARGFT